MASELERAIARNRAALLREDRIVRAELADAYGTARQGINTRLADLAPLLAEDPSLGRVMLDQRYRTLLLQIDQEVLALESAGTSAITGGQARAVRLAGDAAYDLVAAQGLGVGVFDALPTGAVESLVGSLSDGSPVRALLAEQGVEAASAARAALIEGVSLGEGVRPLGKRLAAILDRSQWRGEMLARNAVLDAHRQSSLDRYAARPDLLQGWRWMAARSERTCLACLSLDGRVFPLSTRFFARHVACRCSPAPVLHDRFGPISAGETGADWFARQPEAVQRGMVPRALYDDLKSGKVALSDFVVQEKSRRWGPSYRQGTIGEVRRNAASRAVPRRSLRPVPKGDAVSASIRLPSGELGERLRPALDAIDGVHGTTNLPTVGVKRIARKDAQATYEFDPKTGRPSFIGVSPHSAEAELGLVHEVGHVIDHQLLGQRAGWFGSGTPRGTVLESWEGAVLDSRATSDLQRLRTGGDIGLKLSDGSTMEYEPDTQYTNYLLDRTELFARSYSQWVAQRSGDPTLLAQFNKVRRQGKESGYMEFWDDDDFEPIAKALDGAFRAKGWLA